MTNHLRNWPATIAQIDAIVPGCKFHVASDVENFRVNRFGGEQEFTRLMIESIREGDVFYDVGTCIGFVAVHAAKRGAKVIGFEPEPELRRRTLQNLALNDLHSVTVVDWAVSDRVSVMNLFTDGPHGNSPTLSATNNRTAIPVATRSIDSAIKTGTILPPDLIKLDIEGAEVAALRGMQQLLTAHHRPRKLFIEIHPPMITAMGEKPSDIPKLLTGSNYSLTWEEERSEQLHQVWDLSEPKSTNAHA